MGEGLGQAIGFLVTIAIAAIIGVFLLGSYVTFDFFSGDIVKSSKRINPEIELTTDGKKVDTLFIYRINN